MPLQRADVAKPRGRNWGKVLWLRKRLGVRCKSHRARKIVGMRIELPFFLVESWRKDEHLIHFREQFRFDRVRGALDARKGILVFEMIATDVEWDHSKHRLEFRPPEIQDDFAAPTILEHAARAEQSLPHHELCEPKWAVKIRKPALSRVFHKSMVLILIQRTHQHAVHPT